MSAPGPAPNPHARRRNKRPDWVTLPAGGRSGPTPKWPLKGRTPAGWVDLWKLPQAVMWERDNAVLQVATYLTVRNAAHSALAAGEPNAALLSELRQMEDRLGLSPMALKRLQWQIDEGSAKPSSEGTVVDASSRFANL